MVFAAGHELRAERAYGIAQQARTSPANGERVRLAEPAAVASAAEPRRARPLVRGACWVGSCPRAARQGAAWTR